ncbi:hypothetical protein GGI17_006627 [Coemansia sp. S146]|nr:hypothetical protein GGI17_006627 [Coemansia sp. S146]
MSLIDIDITDYEDITLISGQAGTHIVQQVHSILKATTMLYLVGETDSTHVLKAIKTAPTAAVIQGLELWDQLHDSCEILSIISALPSLTTLTCQISGSAPSIEVIPASEHPIALHEKYHSLNSNFRHLFAQEAGRGDNNWSDESDSDNNYGTYDCPCCGGFHSDSDEDKDDDKTKEVDRVSKAKKIAIVAAQIAVLCLKFTRVDLSSDMRKVFSREIALAMTSGSFLTYADSLSRLIYPE